ncbi:hypothetical protein ACSFBI_18950 [Variovorax sp. RB3P1]|uniref:hypothetical protein n=1 Tax=Variovorax sp. RB3P1 TaxID=3443732 RepID=UPI003F45E49D
MSWSFQALIALVMVWAGLQNAHAVKLPALGGGAAVSQAGKSSTVAVGGAGNAAVRSPTAGGAELDKVLGNRPYSVGGSEGAGELARLSQKGRVPVGDREVPAAISAPVARDAVIGGAVGLITGGVPGAVIGAGTPLLLDWMDRSGLRKNPDTGEPEATDTSVCTVAPCYGYTYNGKTFTDPAAVCAEYDQVQSAYYAQIWTSIAATATSSGVTCTTGIKSLSGSVLSQPSGRNSGAVKISVPPKSVTWYPATPQAIRDKLYNSSAPTTLIVKELLEKGADLELGPTRVTGPAEVTGDKRVRTLPDGSKVEEQDAIRYGYDGGKVTELSRRTTVTNISPTGERTPAGTSETTTGESESTAPPQSEGEKEPDTPPTDTPLPPVPDLYVRKYPNGMEGIYNQYKDQLKNTSLVQLSKQLMPNVGDGGTCPSWPINLNWDWWIMYGVHDVAPPCWIWAVGKAILILSALLLARALIFGG